MTGPGPKGKPPALKIISGTDQPSRRREPVVPVLAGAGDKPKWLKGPASKLYDVKAATYAARGQSVVGCEAALAQFCALEASLIEQYRKKQTPPTAQITALRMFAAEFFDTPASQIGKAPSPKGGKFASNGRPPEPEGSGGA